MAPMTKGSASCSDEAGVQATNIIAKKIPTNNTFLIRSFFSFSIASNYEAAC
jgi:hypothetical protein